MNLLKEAIHKYQVDVLLLNEIQLKWILVNEDKMNQELKQLGREMKAIGADTKKWEVAPNTYLPSSIISALRGKAKSLMVEELVYKRRLGNWLAVKLSIYNKTIAIINIYRI